MVAVSALFFVITRFLVGVRGGSSEDPLEYRGVKSRFCYIPSPPHSKKNKNSSPWYCAVQTSTSLKELIVPVYVCHQVDCICNESRGSVHFVEGRPVSMVTEEFAHAGVHFFETLAGHRSKFCLPELLCLARSAGSSAPQRQLQEAL